ARRDTARRARRRARAPPRRGAAARRAFRLSLRRAVLDPLANYVDRRRRKVRSAIGHAVAEGLRALELMDKEAGIGIARDHPDQVRVARAGNIYQISGAESGIEPQSILRPRASVAIRHGAGDRKDVVLDGGERRLEPGRRRVAAAAAT